MNIFYYDVAVDIPVRQCFTYKSISKIKKGTRVTVPFGKKTLIGIVIKVSSISTSIVKTSAIKEIISVDDQYICFKKPLFNTLLWASEYYHHPIGEVFLSFLPSILRKQTNKSIINIDETSNYKINSADKNFDLTSEQEIALKKLKKNRRIQSNFNLRSNWIRQDRDIFKACREMGSREKICFDISA